MRLAVDMDEVLADTLGKQLQVYNQRFGAHIDTSQLTGCELVDIVPPEHSDYVRNILHEPGFFANLEPIKDALETMKRLCREHRVYIASAATEFPSSFKDKMRWIAHHLPQIPTHRIIFCGDKSVLDVDCLVDDTPSHFAGLRGAGLLFDAPHNRRDRRFSRVRNWAEVEAAVGALAAPPETQVGD